MTELEKLRYELDKVNYKYLKALSELSFVGVVEFAPPKKMADIDEKFNKKWEKRHEL